MIVRAKITNGFVGCDVDRKFEFDDDATDEDIEEFVREWMNDQISLYWEKVES